MKAAVLTTPSLISKSPLQIEEVPTPAPKPGHVLLRVLACGVCRTDLHIVEGELPARNPRVIPGHQIVGEVIGGDIGTRGTGGSPVQAERSSPSAFCRRGIAKSMSPPAENPIASSPNRSEQPGLGLKRKNRPLNSIAPSLSLPA